MKGSTNNITENTRSVIYIISDNCCEVCDSNINCSIHHIFGRISSSIYNNIALCGKHHREADKYNKNGSGSFEYRRNLLAIHFKKLFRDAWWQIYQSTDERRANQFFLEQEEVKKAMLVIRDE